MIPIGYGFVQKRILSQRGVIVRQPNVDFHGNLVLADIVFFSTDYAYLAF